MRYTTNYDIGDRKRGRGINEDSLAITVFEQGHRDGYRGQRQMPDDDEETAEELDDDTEIYDQEAADAAAAATDSDIEQAVAAETEESTGADELDGPDEPDHTERPPEPGQADESAQPDDADGAAQSDPDEEATESEAAAGESDDSGEGADPDAAADEPEEPVGRPRNRSAGVFVLADGAGGHDAGDAASYIATTVISEHLAPVAINATRSHPEGFDIDISPEVLPQQLGEEDIQTGLENAIIDAHREILRYAEQSGTQSYTTVVAGVYADGQLHLGWVGDSRAYLVNDDREEIVRLTKDHAVVEEMADEGEIDDVEGHVHPKGNEITRALGGAGHENPDRAMVDVDTRSVSLFAEDTVLVTSDGLIDAQTDAPELYQQYVEAGRSDEVGEDVLDAVVTDAEIRDVLLSADSLDDAAMEYVTLANERGGKDNISVLLFEDEALPSTPVGGLPIRAVDPDVDMSERQTVLFSEE